MQRVEGDVQAHLLHILHSLWLCRKHPHERGHERRVLKLDSFSDCEYALRGLWGLGCACGFGLRGCHLIGTLSFGTCGPLLVLLAIQYLQANILAALLVEMVTTVHEDQGKDKSDDDANEDADDDDPN